MNELIVTLELKYFGDEMPDDRDKIVVINTNKLQMSHKFCIDEVNYSLVNSEGISFVYEGETPEGYERVVKNNKGVDFRPTDLWMYLEDFEMSTSE